MDKTVCQQVYAFLILLHCIRLEPVVGLTSKQFSKLVQNVWIIF